MHGAYEIRYAIQKFRRKRIGIEGDEQLSDPWWRTSGLGVGTDIFGKARACERRGKHINDWADAGDDESVTRAINGGVNGLAERLRLTAVASAYLCGSASVRAYQGARQLAADGVAGPITRGMLHRDLSALPPVTFALT